MNYHIKPLKNGSENNNKISLFIYKYNFSITFEWNGVPQVNAFSVSGVSSILSEICRNNDDLQHTQ